MSKLDWFTILVISVCLLAIGALVWNMKGLLNNEKPQADITEEYIDAENDADDSETYDINIDGDGDGDNQTANRPAAADKQENADAINYNLDKNIDAGEPTTVIEKEEPKTATKSEPFVNTTPSNSTTTSENSVSTAAATTGKYMVIVGSYRQMTSAERMKKMLRNKGFDANIKKFDNGAYARVLVGRRHTLAAARELKAQLADDGFLDVLISTK